MIRFAENLNKMITAGLGGAMEAPSTEVAVGHRVRYMDASGAVANFETNVVAPIRSLRVDMLPIQAGSGDPSPDNVRPISGRDSVTVMRTGKNLFNKTTVTPTRFVSADGTLAYSANYAASDYIPVKAGVSMIVSGLTASSAAIKTAFYDREKVFISTVSQNKPTYSFTAPSGAEYARITVPNADLDTAQLEIGSTPSAYAPYDGQSVTVQLGQTVYGGTVDVTGGSAESEAIKINANDLPTPSVDSGNTGDGYYSFNFVLPARKYAISGKQLLSKCNILPYIDSGKTARYAFFYMLEGHFRQLKIVVYSETELTKDTVKQWLSDHGFELVYYTDPTPLTLTPASLSTLLGDNTVWSDAGDVALEYPYYEETEGY